MGAIAGFKQPGIYNHLKSQLAEDHPNAMITKTRTVIYRDAEINAEHEVLIMSYEEKHEHYC